MFRGKLAVSFKECVEKSSHIHLFLSVCKAYVREPPPKRKKMANTGSVGRDVGDVGRGGRGGRGGREGRGGRGGHGGREGREGRGVGT